MARVECVARGREGDDPALEVVHDDLCELPACLSGLRTEGMVIVGREAE